MITETQELLANFVKNGAESAFRELVTRYFDLVYSTAVRLVDGDTHRAKDVSQVVFADLAKMAGKLSPRTTLGGWLHRHTCFVARTVMRGERRRRARERQAVEMNALNDNDSVLPLIAPILDETIQELGPDDRDAILLRFFEQRNLRSIGEALGTSENVAQKRVARAVEALGALLQRRGVALSLGGLAGALATSAVTAAPVGLALSLAGTVWAGAGASGIAASAEVAISAKLTIALVGAIIVVGIVTAIFLQPQPRKLIQPSNSPVQPVNVEQAEHLPDSESASLQVPVSTTSVKVRNVKAPNAEVSNKETTDTPKETAREPAPQSVNIGLGPIQGVYAGEISGTVTLKGTPPPEQPNAMLKADPNCGKLHTEPVTTHFYVVGENKGLGDVFIMLKGVGLKGDGALALPAILDQKACQYKPYIFAVQTNQKIIVKNSDPFMHNVHPTPAQTAAGNAEANKAQMPGAPDLIFTFPAPEVFLKFTCNVHPWMFAYVCVVDHPYFAVTDKDGNYSITNVPDGKYKMEVYHRKAAPLSAPMTNEVTVSGGKVMKDFTIEAK